MDLISLHENDDDSKAGKRKFTVKAIENCEMLSLCKMDLYKLDLEFNDIFMQIFKYSLLRFNRSLKAKKDAEKFYHRFKDQGLFEPRVTNPKNEAEFRKNQNSRQNPFYASLKEIDEGEEIMTDSTLKEESELNEEEQQDDDQIAVSSEKSMPKRYSDSPSKSITPNGSFKNWRNSETNMIVKKITSRSMKSNKDKDEEDKFIEERTAKRNTVLERWSLLRKNFGLKNRDSYQDGDDDNKKGRATEGAKIGFNDMNIKVTRIENSITNIQDMISQLQEFENNDSLKKLIKEAAKEVKEVNKVIQNTLQAPPSPKERLRRSSITPVDRHREELNLNRRLDSPLRAPLKNSFFIKE